MKGSEQNDHSSAATATSIEGLRALAGRFQALLEQQRTRLAQELHDNLTQKLTVVSLELSLMDASIQSEQGLSRAKLREKVKELNALVNDMIQSLRRIKTELRPKVLDEFGLVAAIEWESGDFERRTGVRCAVTVPAEEIMIPAHVATEIFRMFQGILANVAEHSQARSVRVDLAEDGSWLLLKVADDGRGISREAIDSPKSLGLLEFRERTAALGGELTLDGSSGSGTTVTIKAPLKSPPPARKGGR